MWVGLESFLILAPGASPGNPPGRRRTTGRCGPITRWSGSLSTPNATPTQDVPQREPGQLGTGRYNTHPNPLPNPIGVCVPVYKNR